MLLRIKLQPCWKTQIYANSHTFYFVPILVDFKGWSLLRFFQHCTKPKLPCFARCRCLGDCTVCQQAWLPRSSCCAADNWSVLAFFRQKGEQEVLGYSGKYFFSFMFIYVHIIYIYRDGSTTDFWGWISTWHHEYGNMIFNNYVKLPDGIRYIYHKHR